MTKQGEQVDPGAGILAPWPSVIVTDATGRVTHWNEAAERLYGWSAAEAVGRATRDLIIAAEDHDVAADILGTLLAGEPWEGRFHVHDRHGSGFDVQVRDIPLLGPDGQVVAVIGLSVPTADLADDGPAAAFAARMLAAQRSTVELVQMHALTTALSSAADVREVAEVALGPGRAAVQAFAGMLALLRDGELQVVRTAGYSDVPDSRRVPLGAALPMPEAARSGRPVWVASPSERRERWPDLEVGTDVSGGGVVLPLMVDDTCIGTLAYSFEDSVEWDPAGRRMPVLVAAQVAQALHRALIHEQLEEALVESERVRALLDTVLWTVPVGMAVLDRGGRFQRVNEALAEMHGQRASALLGHTVREVLPELPAEQIERHLAQVLETGEPVRDVDVTSVSVGLPGSTRHWITSYYPVCDEAGDLFAIGTVVHEVTALLEAQTAAEVSAEHLGRLHQLGSALAAAESADEATAIVLRDGLAAPGAATGALWLLTEDDAHLRFVRGVGLESGVAESFAVLPMDAPLPGPHVVARREPMYFRSREERDERYPVLVGTPTVVEAIAVVPLVVEDRCFGCLAFGFSEVVDFDVSTQQFLRALADLCAQALDRGRSRDAERRLFAERSAVAVELQRSLLPPRLPEIPGIELAARYHPAYEGLEVGGDFYDVFQKNNGDWALLVGDVVGTGPRAAAATALVRHTVRAIASRVGAMRELVVAVDAALRDEGEAESFCTMAFGQLHPLSGGRMLLSLLGAGHPYPVVVQDGRPRLVELGGGLLGAFPAEPVPPTDIELSPGDLLVLYTDGVIEARVPAVEGVPLDLFGDDRLLDVLADTRGLSAAEVASRLESAVLDFAGGRATDDMAILVVRVSGA